MCDKVHTLYTYQLYNSLFFALLTVLLLTVQLNLISTHKTRHSRLNTSLTLLSLILVLLYITAHLSYLYTSK